MENSMRLNIYSEPLFPASQISLPSTQSTQTQDTTLGTQREGKSQKVCHSGDGAKRMDDIEDEESDKDSQSSEFEFKLDSMVIKASKMSQDYCTTGCQHMDNALCGGIPTFGITELYGEAGSGKTQLCLQLAITSQLSQACDGLNAGVFYICTEDVLPTKRLAELVQYFKNKFSDDLPDNPMNHIFIEHVTSAEELMQCVDVKLATLARNSSNRKIRLVILDSVAAIFRTELDDIAQRTEELRKLAQTLHEFSYDHEATIVVCNQVTASPSVDGNIASLGMAWKNMITTRICMTKSETGNRSMYVCFSPHVPSVAVGFQITASGIEVIPPQ